MNQFDSNSSAKKPLPSIKKVIITWVFVPVFLISAALLTWHAQSIYSAEEMQRQQTATGLKRAIDSYYTDEHTIHQGAHDWTDILHAVQHQFDTEVAAIGIGTPDRIILSGRDGAKITLSKFIANHFKQVDHFKWDAQTYWLNDLIVYMPIRHPDLHAGMSQPDIDYHLFAIFSPKNYADI